MCYIGISDSSLVKAFNTEFWTLGNAWKANITNTELHSALYHKTSSACSKMSCNFRSYWHLITSLTAILIENCLTEIASIFSLFLLTSNFRLQA
jgi:hypothetical protein